MRRSFLFFIAVLGVFVSYGQKSLVGAIRWDAWTGDNPNVVNDPGEQVERSLGPNKYHFRLPFFGVEVGANEVDTKGNIQAVIDQEISYAKFAGIDYWAFVYYPTSESNLGDARNLYDASAFKNDIKYCYIVDDNPRMPASNFAFLVSKFSEPNYQKVLGNRPIFYLFSPSIYSASEIATLRSMTTAAGLGTPYIVVMDFSAGSAAEGATTIGADAISSYATTTGGGGAYAGLASEEVTNWNTYRSTGKNVIPWITTGWDPRPRIDNPVTWVTYASNSWTQTATAPEIANHLQQGLDWVNSNSSVVNANTVLMYAWNEFDEGGWLAPTKIPATSAIDSSRIKSVRGVTNGLPCGTSLNLARCKTYSSSSNWDVNQTASQAFDGNMATNWQAASGTSFGSQWLQVNFGTPTQFDSVKLSEYGNRTSGYRIEYSNDGSTWQVAYTGTTIGTSRTVGFSAVTANFIRIVFTAGANTPIIYEFEVFKKPSSSGPNIALNRMYSSSSSWDGNQIAGKAFDGSISTNWQAGSGTSFNGQWLQVNFGSSVVFNKVVLSEYGDRTTIFRIEYSVDGIAWQTAFAGTTIGNNRVLNFSPVTSNYARIYFVSGANTAIIYEFEVYNTLLGGGVNLIQNPSFDVDNVDTQTPTVWSTWSSLGTYDADYTGSGYVHSGARSLGHWRNGTYLVYTYQLVTGLTNGTYTATVYARTIGSPAACLIQAQDYGGSPLITSISGNTFSKYTISNIQVTNGQCMIGLYTEGNQNSAAVFDDVTLSNNNNPYVNRASVISPVFEEKSGRSEIKLSLIYPNPSHGEIAIVYGLSPRTNASISVFTIDGKLVKRVKFLSGYSLQGKLLLDIVDLVNGTYVIRLEADNQVVSRKIFLVK